MSNAPKRFAEMTGEKLYQWVCEHKAYQWQPALAALRDAIRAEAYAEHAPMEDTIAALRTRAERAERERDAERQRADLLDAASDNLAYKLTAAESALGEVRREGAREALTRYAKFLYNVELLHRGDDCTKFRDREYPATPSGDGVTCKSCKGTGTTLERHGPGLTEELSCVDCQGTGTRAIPQPEPLVIPVSVQAKGRTAHEIDAAFLTITPSLARRLLALAQTTTEER